MKVTPNLSKSRIKRHQRRKTNPVILDTINAARKSPAWLPIIRIIANSTKKHAQVNLMDIDAKTTAGDTVVVPGKVLSLGDLTKKVRICSLSISESALDKLKQTKSEYVSILQEIKINPKAQGLKLIQ